MAFKGGVIMEIKPWNEYSISEKRTLLNFWFANINRDQDMITKEDREQFQYLLKQDIDLIMDYVVALTMLGSNSETMLFLMRSGNLEKTLKNVLPRMKEDEDYQFMKKKVITILVGMCNITMSTTDEQEIITRALQIAIEAKKEIVKRYS